MTAAEVLAAYAPAAALSPSCPPGDGELSGRLLMAPMAGVSDAAYRLMARAGGAALAYSEMVSCAGLHYGEKSWELVDPDPAEPDIAVQLFGSKPELFRESAERVAARLGESSRSSTSTWPAPCPR